MRRKQKEMLPKNSRKNPKNSLDKPQFLGYNNEADFGGSEVTWTMAA